ncbi:MAG: UDP-N-acetylmuramate dehydrogenase [Patescibacteria group bacterium]|jgi:UDP-N-acetylmuramate dehydrogenase
MEIYQKLKEKLGENLQENEEMKQYSTFKLGGPAKYFFIAKNKRDIVKAVKVAKELSLDFFILGGGSNILVSDSGYSGLVIKIENREIKINGETIKADSGTTLEKVTSLAAQNALSTMEWASGIPGTVGGAVRGNAGAYGADTSNNILEVEVYDIEKDRVVIMENSECGFEYRESIFKKDKNLIILGAVFQLQKGDKEEIKSKILENAKARICSQPKFPSVGCNFKNIIITPEIKKKLKEIIPEIESKIKGGKMGAALLIDQADLKGHKIGGVKVSDEHANFIVKFQEDGTAQNVFDLINYVKNKIKERYGIELEEEVQCVGFTG